MKTHVSLIALVCTLLCSSLLSSGANLNNGERPTGRRTLKVAVLNYEPIYPSGKPYWEELSSYQYYMAPSNAYDIMQEEIREATDGMVDFQLVHWTNVNMFPYFDDAAPYRNTNRFGQKRYTTNTYLIDRQDNFSEYGAPPKPNPRQGVGGVLMMITNDFPHIIGMVERGEVDHVVTFGANMFGLWETCMVGDGAYWCNGGPVVYTNQRLFVMSGMNLERPGSGLHNYGHGLAENGIGSWFCDLNVADYDNSAHSAYPTVNDWVLFSRCRNNLGGGLGASPIHIGNTHHAPNSTTDYQYDNSSDTVTCYADQWYDFPIMTAAGRSMNSRSAGAWYWSGEREDDAYQKWFWNHIPRYMGSEFAAPTNRFRKGHMNNWLNYVWNANYVGYPIGSGQPVIHEDVDMRGSFSYRIEVPSGTTQVKIEIDSNRSNFRAGLRKNLVPYLYRLGSSDRAADNYSYVSDGNHSWTLDAFNNYGKGLEGVWYVSFGDSGESWNNNTYTQAISVTITPTPTNSVDPTITINYPQKDDIVDVVNGERATISWNVSGLPQGERATYIAYQLTNGVSEWIPVAEDYVFNIDGSYEWILPSTISTNARVKLIIEDVYGNMYEEISDTFYLNSRGAYASCDEWKAITIPDTWFRYRHTALGSDGSSIFFTRGESTPADFYSLPKGSLFDDAWATLTDIPVGVKNNDSGLGDFAYFDGYLWTIAQTNGASNRSVYRYDIANDTWKVGTPFGGGWWQNVAIAPLAANRMYAAHIGNDAVNNITDWANGTVSSIAGLGDGASHPWDSCITPDYVYFIKHKNTDQQNEGVFARVNVSGTPTATVLSGGGNWFNPGMGCALEYMPGELFLDGRDRIYALRGGTGSGTTDGSGWTTDTTSGQLAIYDIDANTWSVEDLPWPIDDGSEMCRADDILYILAANGQSDPLKLKIFPEPGILLTTPTNAFSITGGDSTNIAWNTGRIPTGVAATNSLYYTTNGISGDWILIDAGDARSFTNTAWMATPGVDSSECYFRVIHALACGLTFTNDSPESFSIVYVDPLSPDIVITNDPITVSTATTSVKIHGSNTVNAVGGLRWTNENNSANGVLAVGSPWWSPITVSLGYGPNTIVVEGTNVYGAAGSASIVIVRDPPDDPYVNITMDDTTVPHTMSLLSLPVTNTMSTVGSLLWNNTSAGIGGSTPAAPTLSRSISVPLDFGENKIIVSGTNIVNSIHADTVTVYRSTSWTNIPVPTAISGENFDTIRSWLCSDHEGNLYVSEWKDNGTVFRLPFNTATNPAMTGADWYSLGTPPDFVTGNSGDDGKGVWITGGSNGMLYTSGKTNGCTFRGILRLNLSNETWIVPAPNSFRDGVNYGMIAREVSTGTWVYGQHCGNTAIKQYFFATGSDVYNNVSPDATAPSYWGMDMTLGEDYAYLYSSGRTDQPNKLRRMSTLTWDTSELASGWKDAIGINNSHNNRTGCAITFIPDDVALSVSNEVWVLPAQTNGVNVSVIHRYLAINGDYIDDIALPFTMNNLGAGGDMAYLNGWLFVLQGGSSPKVWAMDINPTAMSLSITNQNTITTNSTCDIYVENNQYVVGGLWWTNAATTATGTMPAYPSISRTIYDIALSNGVNVITVYGTNEAGTLISDSVTYNRTTKPLTWTNIPLPALDFDNLRSWMATDKEGYVYAARWNTDGDIYKIPFDKATNATSVAGDWVKIDGPANFAGNNNDNGTGASIIGGSNGNLYAVLKLSTWGSRGWGKLNLETETWTTTPNQLDGANYGVAAIEKPGNTYLYGQHFGWTKYRGYQVTNNTTMAYIETAQYPGVNFTYWGGDATMGDGYLYFYDQGGYNGETGRFLRASLDTLPIPANTMNASSPWKYARAYNDDHDRRTGCEVAFVPASHTMSGRSELWVIPVWDGAYVSVIEKYYADDGTYKETINLPFTIDALDGYDIDYMHGHIFVMDGRNGQRNLWCIPTIDINPQLYFANNDGVTTEESPLMSAINSSDIVGTISWTNLATGASGTYNASAGSDSFTLDLALNTNVIQLIGQTAYGAPIKYEHTVLRAGSDFMTPNQTDRMTLQANTSSNIVWRNGWMGHQIASNYLAWSSAGLSGPWTDLTNGTANATVTNFVFTAPDIAENTNCYFRVVHYVHETATWATNYSDQFTIIPEPVSIIGIIALISGLLLTRFRSHM